MLLTFIPAVGDYVNAYFLGGPNQAMIGNVIQGQYLQLANYPTAAALSFVLMALIMVVVVIYLWRVGAGALMGDDEEAAPRAARARLGAGRVRARGACRLGAASTRLGAYAAVAIAYMLIPIAVIVLFSFNDPSGNFNISWQGFTLDHWRDPFADQALTDALLTSLKLAALSTVIATAIGTAAGAGARPPPLPRPAGGEHPRAVPMATPEVVIGAALLSMFVYLDVARGFTTLLIAHVMFSISFVVVVVRSRLIGFDPALEEAAADLGAGPLARFRTVTLPLLAPGRDRRGGARLRPVDRRLRRLQLQLGDDRHLPALHLRRLAARDPGRGQRALDDAVRGRGRRRSRSSSGSSAGPSGSTAPLPGRRLRRRPTA